MKVKASGTWEPHGFEQRSLMSITTSLVETVCDIKIYQDILKATLIYEVNKLARMMIKHWVNNTQIVVKGNTMCQDM